jgi:hypothetical protein
MTEHNPSEAGADRRRVKRIPTTLRGKVFPGEADCIVADMSEAGACLTFEDQAANQDRLLLVIWSTGLAFDAEVRWRQGQRVGLRFVARCDFHRRTPAAFHEARTLWRRSRPKLRKPYRSPRPPLLGVPS